ncbi:MAG: hypothetical protein RR049_08100 [Angelakisella sp.]
MKAAFKILRRVAYTMLSIGLVLAIIGGMLGATLRDMSVSIIPGEYLWERYERYHGGRYDEHYGEYYDDGYEGHRNDHDGSHRRDGSCIL